MSNNIIEKYDDPSTRCWAISGDHQCINKQVEGLKYCPMHGGQVDQAKVKEMYRITKWTERINHFKDHSEIKSLRNEIGVIRLIVEEVLDKCQDSQDLLLHSSKITDLIMKIEKIVGTCHKIEVSMGSLLGREQITQLAEQILTIITTHVTDPDILEAIGNQIIEAILGKTKDS